MDTLVSFDKIYEEKTKLCSETNGKFTMFKNWNFGNYEMKLHSNMQHYKERTIQYAEWSQL